MNRNKFFLENCKIFNEQGKFIDLDDVQDEIKYIIENDLINTTENSKFCKKFYEEICPVCYLAKHFRAREIRLTNDIKEHLSFDAIIRFKDGR